MENEATKWVNGEPTYLEQMWSSAELDQHGSQWCEFQMNVSCVCSKKTIFNFFS